MNHPATSGMHWLTSSFGDSAEASPRELGELGEHLARCRHRRHRLFTLRHGAGVLGGFMLARIVTSALALLLLLAALLSVL